MSLKETLLTPAERRSLEHTALKRHLLEEQYESLEQQHETAAFGMWVFLATEVMFFGTLFLGVFTYWLVDTRAVEEASTHLKWIIGGINTVVLLVSSLMMVLAVHYASQDDRAKVVRFLGLTAGLGAAFLGLKAFEYYQDFQEHLVPGLRFDDQEWVHRGLNAGEIAHVKIFLLFYWIMTGFHALHMLIGISVVLLMAWLARREHFSASYYTPIEVTGLYWHFVDIVWIFLLPTLYLLGTHHL